MAEPGDESRPSSVRSRRPAAATPWRRLAADRAARWAISAGGLAIILSILNDAWRDNWGFVPLTPPEIKDVGVKLKPIVFNDLIRIAERRKPKKKRASEKRESEEPNRKARQERRAEKAFDQVLETIDDLVSERSDEDILWGSMVKQALKRRRPGFNESYYGVRSFSDLLEEAQSRGLLGLSLDERSGGYVIEKIESG